MKRLFVIPVLLMLLVSIGCRENVITRLEVGREKLLGAGLAIEAIEDLKIAETKEAKNEFERNEAKALLLIAYSHALETGDAGTHKVAAEYKSERARRLASMDEAVMKKVFEFFGDRARTHQAVKQMLVEKGAPVVPLLVKSLGQSRYVIVREDVIEMLRTIGPEAVDGIVAGLKAPDTSEDVKATLISLLGQINDPKATSALAALQKDSPELEMEINVALYQLGNKEYRDAIIDGLSNSDVRVRRAAAKAMPLLNDTPPGDKILNALKDEDEQVRMYAAQTLEKHPTQDAITPLIELLKSGSSEAAKHAAKQALIVHSEQPYGKGLAKRLVRLLPQTADPQDRVRIVLILSTDALFEQLLKAPKLHDDDIVYELYQYYSDKEDNELVKEELGKLLRRLP